MWRRHGCYALTLGLIAQIGAARIPPGHSGRGWALPLGIMLLHYRWIKGRERMACFRAFLHNNYVGMAIFLGLALATMLR